LTTTSLRGEDKELVGVGGNFQEKGRGAAGEGKTKKWGTLAQVCKKGTQGAGNKQV